MNVSFKVCSVFSSSKMINLSRLEKAYKCYGSVTSVLADRKRFCELCGKRNYTSESPDAKHLEFLRSLKEGDHEMRNRACSKKLISLTEEDLLERFRNLQSLNIVNYDTLDSLPLLAKHPFTISNRVEVLLEAGFQEDKITVTSLAKYLKLVKQTILTLKKHQFIPQNVDVMTHILKYVDLEPQFYPEEMLDSSTSLLTIRKAILRAFLKRRFGMTDQEVKNGGQNITRLWNKSFTTINRNMKLVINDVGMPTETLRRNIYLLALNPANTETILKEVKMVGDIDITTALKVRPKIMCNTCGNLTRILRLLKEYDIPQNINYGVLELFTLCYETVKERLEELNDVEYFSVNRAHPRILALVMAQVEAKKRLKLLEEINLVPGSLNTLVTNRRFFERYVTEGFRQNGVKDVMFFLVNQYGCNMHELRKKLDKHPYWATVSLIEVGRNAKFLSKHLSREEVLECPLVLFYPSEKVQEEFFKLSSREGIESCKENGRVKTKLIAPLLTYFIEQEANFSLQGIWSGDSSSSEATDAPHVHALP